MTTNNESLDARVLRLAETGLSRAQIGKALARDDDSIRGALRRLRSKGLLTRHVPGGFRKRGEDLKAKMWAEREAGYRLYVASRGQGARKDVPQDMQAMIDAHLANYGVTVLPARYAEGATPEPEQAAFSNRTLLRVAA